MSHPYLEQARGVIEIERQAIDRVAENLDEHFVSSVEAILSALQNRGKIVVVGVGKSGNIGHKIAATLNSTGATAVVLNSQNALHGDLGLISENDVVIAMSYSGETPELVGLIPFIKTLNVPIIALTSKPQSSLGKYADHVLDSSVEQEACPLNLAPTSSSTAMLVLGDALAMVLLEARGFTKEDFARFHPGGSLGRALLTKVNDIMRPIGEMAILEQSAKVLTAVKLMSTQKTGAAVMTENEKMVGIFTHGDFVRHYTSDHDIGEKTLSEVMTKNPITIQEDVLAAQAVTVLSEHKIDDLVVIDHTGNPVGMIDSQDLAKHKLI